MQTGKLILSAAALVVTAASTLAFKAANKFSNGTKLFVQVTSEGANIACATCRSVRTNVAGGVALSSCATKISGVKVAAQNGKTYFTRIKAGSPNNRTCTAAFSKATLSL